jgi:hypothetical protein
VGGRRTPYAELIENYDANNEMRLYSEEAINEMFSLEEAEAWMAWLKSHQGGCEHEIEEAKLPINTMGVGAIPVGGEQDFLMVNQEPDYDLPFTVWDSFDLRLGSASPYSFAEATRRRGR